MQTVTQTIINVAIYVGLPIIALGVIIAIAWRLLMVDSGERANGQRNVTHEKLERLPQTEEYDTLVMAKLNAAWFKARAEEIASDITSSEDYWQNIIESGHLAKAWWLNKKGEAA